ncbi:hypothetical protein [Streptomyces swartbergensis]|uniref:Uncharacterized protein n=1 Tax=Streptomyces swartbergensis TaxID=487165 RepID=A0A243S1L6_9ACTN|nr:hypothetical protein [Streptomyces swartbergensis]OUD01472.1 hypothetical protein CA983_19960 [Streptomyces swartbergensis]
MNTNDLQRLSGYLNEHGLRVTADENDMRLHVSNPLNSRLSEEIVLAGDRYVTSFAHEIGERGGEQECAKRIARMLAVGAAAVREGSA